MIYEELALKALSKFAAQGQEDKQYDIIPNIFFLLEKKEDSINVQNDLDLYCSYVVKYCSSHIFEIKATY